MRNTFNRKITIASADFFSNKVEKNKYDSKELWQQLILWDININIMKTLKMF